MPMTRVVARGSCPLCGEVFTGTEAYRVHLNGVHNLFDDPGTETSLPALVEIPDEPVPPGPPPPQRRRRDDPPPTTPVAGGPDPSDDLTAPAAVAPRPADSPPPVAPANPRPAPRTTSEIPAAAPIARTDEDDAGADGGGGPGRRSLTVKAGAVAAVAVALVLATGLSQRTPAPAGPDETPEPATPVVAAEPLPEEEGPGPDHYVVQRGDTLSAIATRLGTTIEALAAANGIGDPNIIHPGQVLHPPGPGE
jgi:LysM repeat protein